MTLKKAAGYILLALSCLAWAVIFVLPLFEISVGEVAALTTGLIVAGEAAFFLGITLLGREAWEKIKAVFRKKQS
ncbi:MAG: transporter suffix domain-containing protein [Gallionella sp.]|nr:transporter suffix domain-containing protein [Gallionella sp.]